MNTSEPTHAERKQLLENELARFVSILRQQKDADRVLVFGSLATGEVHPWSDIDLIIIQRTSQPFYQRLRTMRKLLRPKVGVDILVYTPEEFEQLQNERPFFRQEMLGKSKVVYERQR